MFTFNLRKNGGHVHFCLWLESFEYGNEASDLSERFIVLDSCFKELDEFQDLGAAFESVEPLNIGPTDKFLQQFYSGSIGFNSAWDFSEFWFDSLQFWLLQGKGVFDFNALILVVLNNLLFDGCHLF